MVGSPGIFQGTKTQRKGTDGVTKSYVSQGICRGVNVSAHGLGVGACNDVGAGE